jgi:cellulose synthase operon protein C
MSSTSKARSSSEAEVDRLAASEGGSADPPSSLPLRLSVARGGLGLEICEPVSAGPFVVEELQLDLPGLRYPLDLSQGVKQFRHRRSQLRCLRLRVDLETLGAAWGDSLRALFGDDVKVRLRPFHESESEPGHSLQTTENDTGKIPSLAVTVYCGDRALAFDLVVASGANPRLIVDSPRTIGRTESPLLLCFQAIDAGLHAARHGSQYGAVPTLARRGRAIEMSGIAEAVALSILPALGCRLPEVKGQVVRSMTFNQGQVEILLGTREQGFFGAGRRGLFASGAADFLADADEQLSGGNDTTLARQRYIEALERAPGHPDALLSLAELDLAAGDRGESTLSFLHELEGTALDVSRQAEARRCLALARGLNATGRRKLALETQERYLEIESDPILSALASVALAKLVESTEMARKILDRAIARAPSLAIPRRERFAVALRSGDSRTALSDAEHLEATEPELEAKVAVCLWAGGAFAEHGLQGDAQRWLQRALRLDPDHPIAMLRLAESLAKTGEMLRAAELLQAAIRKLLPEVGDAAVEPSAVSEHLTSARYLLAKILLMENHNVPIALGHLSSIETRLSVGLEARLMEADVHNRRGDVVSRDRAISRLLEAVEMGWVDLQPKEQQLRDLVREIENDPATDRSLIEFAARVLSAP